MTELVIPFQIVIGPRFGVDSYPIRAQSVGAEAHAEISIPAALMNSPSDDRQKLGRQLGQALFCEPIRNLLLQTARAADPDSRLQIQLQLIPPEVAALPWEWVSLGSAQAWRPAIRDDYSLVRISTLNAAIEPVRLHETLQILVIAARGEEPQADALEQELSSDLRDGRLDLQVVRSATPERVATALRHYRPHVVHFFAASGLSQRGTPRIQLGQACEAADLKTLLDGQKQLRLVTLAGSQGDNDRSVPALPLLATTLLSEQIPAVIAVGSGLSLREYARFASSCYRQLAKGEAVDLAVTAGRSILAEGEQDWGAVQLRLVPGAQELFRIEETPGLLQRLRLPQRAQSTHTTAAVASSAADDTAPAPQQAASSHTRETRRTTTAAQRPLVRNAEAPEQQPRTARSRVAARTPTRTAKRPSWHLPALIAALVLLVVLVSGRMLGNRSDATAGASASTPLFPQLFATPGPTVTPTPLPTPTPGNPLSVTPPQRLTSYQTAEGDTFESIAERAGSDALAIASYNFLSISEPLRAGRPLVIPIYRDAQDAPVAPIVTSGDPSRPQVALTFDIEIDQESLYAILDVMQQKGVKGTFFLTGRWAEAYPDAAKAIVSAGHELGNHSVSHPYFSTLSPDGAIAELTQTEEMVRQVTGVTTHPYFRFPYGDSTQAMVEIVARQGYVPYHWSADDAAIPNWLSRISANPQSGYGGILLMHGRQATAEALSGYIDQLKALGITPTTLGELMK